MCVCLGDVYDQLVLDRLNLPPLGSGCIIQQCVDGISGNYRNLVLAARGCDVIMQRGNGGLRGRPSVLGRGHNLNSYLQLLC